MYIYYTRKGVMSNPHQIFSYLFTFPAVPFLSLSYVYILHPKGCNVKRKSTKILLFRIFPVLNQFLNR
nr:MAG TPA: hypothetical protein [Caudoviricetes sp.]